jgi:hypothetical protein
MRRLYECACPSTAACARFASIVSTVRELRERKGRVDHAKVRAATEEQIAAWKREDGIDDGALGPIRPVSPVTIKSYRITLPG